MRKNFNIRALMGVGTGQLPIRAGLLALALLNVAALYFYLDPPGGSQQELAQQDQQIRNRVSAMNMQGARIKLMATRVESGSNQITSFEQQYFLPKRLAYAMVIEEIERMARVSGLQERDAGFAEEPIEGTTDLSLLNIKANYEGSYPSLMRFLYEADKSPMLLMLDSLTATPEQRNGQISADIRFQAVLQEQGPNGMVPQAVPGTAAQSAVTQTGVMQPVFMQPIEPQPNAMLPGVMQPGAMQPGVMLPGVNQPGMNQPGVNQPGLGQPGVVQPGVNQPGAMQPGMPQHGIPPGMLQHGMPQQPGVTPPGVVPPGGSPPNSQPNPNQSGAPPIGAER